MAVEKGSVALSLSLMIYTTASCDNEATRENGQSNANDRNVSVFCLDDWVPADHLLRAIDRHVDFRAIRGRLRPLYSDVGRPSINPEVLLRILLIGYLYGITSERRLMDEAGLNLAYRWFTGLGFEQSIPDHLTFSKNRHGRFRESKLFREFFEQIVQRCIDTGLVEGHRFSVDGTIISANASTQSRVPREHLPEAAKVSRSAQEYLLEIDDKMTAVRIRIIRLRESHHL